MIANLLDAQAISELLAAVYRRVVNRSANKREQSLTHELKAVEAKLERLTAAIEEGGDIPALLQRMRVQESQKAKLDAELERLTAAKKMVPSDPASVQRKLESIVADWRGYLLNRPTEARDKLKQLIVDRIVFTPRQDERGRFYELSGRGTVEPVIRGLAPQNLASPTGFEPVS